VCGRWVDLRYRRYHWTLGLRHRYWINYLVDHRGSGLLDGIFCSSAVCLDPVRLRLLVRTLSYSPVQRGACPFGHHVQSVRRRMNP
jgi:hypothetical protein